ncbi:efflux transporter outer membrane subunit [Vreelandella massiliensis]|uniref:efflux transporter outer membrane subunit n=1 Tax=Vreelandella massiliensis TaxID=1816686 RepID=UPI0013566CDA|nr:efflux transporter outer membrane subunit [Halomonas massiliensis]
MLTACASQQEPVSPPVNLPETFSQSGELPTPKRWWTAFDDERLNTLIDQALERNLSLKATYQRLQQARAVVDREAAGLFPTVNASAGAERRETDTTDIDTFSAELSADYEVDLWGRVRAQVEAEEFRARASLADYQAASLSLAGEVSTTWFRILAQRAQQQLAQSQRQTNQDILTLIESRFASGLSDSADVLRQRQLVAASQERLVNVEAERRVLEHQLALLLGQPPAGSTPPEGATLPELPPLPDTGLPLALVQRRPDLEQAFRQLQAADAELAAAISNRFPRLTLSASTASQARSTDELFTDWLSTIAGNLILPLIDGGQRRAEVERQRSLREQRLYEYGQATLTAIQEVEDALVQEQQERQRIESLEQQIALSETTIQQLRLRYFNGSANYIDVLNALQEGQDLRRTLITAHQQLLGFRVALYRALAGSIETSPMEIGDKA